MLPPAEVAVIIPSRDELDVRRTVLSHLQNGPPEGLQIIVIDDASTVGPAVRDGLTDLPVTVIHNSVAVGVARARNQGARVATARVLVFCDAHVRVPADWWKPIRSALGPESVGVVGPKLADLGGVVRGCGETWWNPVLSTKFLTQMSEQPYQVPIIAGCFLAVRRALFEEVHGFDEDFRIWLLEDSEFCLRLWRLGYDSVVVPGVTVRHQFRASDYPSARAEWGGNLLRFYLKHFTADALVLLWRAAPEIGCSMSAAEAVHSLWGSGRTRPLAYIRSTTDFIERFDIQLCHDSPVLADQLERVLGHSYSLALVPELDALPEGSLVLDIRDNELLSIRMVGHMGMAFSTGTAP